MTSSQRSTYEEAKSCPKCGNPGRLSASKHSPNGRIETYTCETPVCSWYNTGWALQILPDGTLAQRDQKDGKQFTTSPFVESLGRNLVKETEFIFGLDKEPDDPEYGVQKSLDEIKRQF